MSCLAMAACGARVCAPSHHSCLQVVRLNGASFGWEPDRPIFDDVNVILERGMRLVIVGPNGAGKSTLLWALAAKLGLQKGKR